MNLFRVVSGSMLLAAASFATPTLPAQEPAITRHDLQHETLSAPGRDVVQVLVRFAPGAVAGSHHHPGEEIVFVTEGTLEYRLDGRPPVILEAGDVLFIPYGVAHEVLNVGPGAAAELATYIVESGQPLVVPSK